MEGFVVVGIIIFVVVVFVLAIKGKKERDEMVSKLTQEQKNILMSTDVNFVENNAWVQNAMVSKLVDKGNKVAVTLLWFNKVLQNNEYNTITIAELTITKSEQQQHNLKNGDFVKMYFAPEKTVGSVKIIWN